MIGIAITSALATGLQWRRSSSRSTNIPSEKRVRISASSISSTIDWSVASTLTTSGRGERDAERDREDGGGENGASDQAGERRDDGQQSTEEQDRVAEPDVHRRLAYPSRFRSTSNSAT